MDFDLLKEHQVRQIIGSDEVGRGPLAGPVVACSVMVNFDTHTDEEIKIWLQKLKDAGITDSKKLTTKRRLNLIAQWGIDVNQLSEGNKYSLVLDNFSISFSIAELSATYIDQNNILVASLEAMRISAKVISGKTGLWVVDGNKKPKTISGIDGPLPIVKGDAKVIIISMASIIAKEYRDNLMNEFDHLYPQYGFGKHSGYPTTMHFKAIKEFGPTPIHRRSFKGVC